MEASRAQPVCAQESLDLLNCVTESSFDQDKCVRLLSSLRECVIAKKVKKFSIPNLKQQEANATSEKS